MATWLGQLTRKARDDSALGRFWPGALGWRVFLGDKLSRDGACHVAGTSLSTSDMMERHEESVDRDGVTERLRDRVQIVGDGIDLLYPLG